MEQEQEYRGLKEDAEDFMGVDPLDDYVSTMPMAKKYERLKQRLFYPEIREATQHMDLKLKAYVDQVELELAKALERVEFKCQSVEKVAVDLGIQVR